MKKITRITTLLCALTLSFGTMAQDDASARALLDRVSNGVRTASFLHVSFEYSIENPKTGLPKNTINGALYLQGENYRVELEDNIQISNGERIWRIIPADYVVETMTLNGDDEMGISPEKMLTLHEEGFNLRKMEKTTIRGVQAQGVRMYPTDVKGAVYTHIDVYVNEGKNQLMRIVEYGKNGTVTTYELNKYHSDSSASAGLFSFNAKDYPDFELIDLDF